MIKQYINYPDGVVDQATWQKIPKDPANKDWQRVLAEIAAGESELTPSQE